MIWTGDAERKVSFLCILMSYVVRAYFFLSLFKVVLMIHSVTCFSLSRAFLFLLYLLFSSSS